MEQRFISGRNNDFITEICKLKQKKYRNQTGLFYIEGLKLFKEVLNSDYIKKLKYIICIGDDAESPLLKGGAHRAGVCRCLPAYHQIPQTPLPPFQKGAFIKPHTFSVFLSERHNVE